MDLLQLATIQSLRLKLVGMDQVILVVSQNRQRPGTLLLIQAVATAPLLPRLPLQQYYFQIRILSIYRIDSILMTFSLRLRTKLLSSQSFRNKVYIGLAHFVDNPSELYHSMAWPTSIKASSGQCATNRDQSQVVLPSDCVYYRCMQSDC